MKPLSITLLILAAFLLVPLAISVVSHTPSSVPWYQASMASSGLAPEPSDVPEAMIQVYAARAYGWRGAFAVHTWIVVKPAGAKSFTRYDVVGWGGGRVVRENYAAADALWYGGRPEILLDLRGGADVERLIEEVRSAVASYPFGDTYRSWPGPNSNTFVAHVAREVPALGVDLPANAIGKDYLPITRPVAHAPSGSGIQVSLLGLAGFIVAPAEGVEIDLLGLSGGLDVLRPALRVPGLGRIGVPDRPQR